MKLLILGITGRTGQLVAEEALKRGHKVVGIVRDPGKLSIKEVEIISGTPYDFYTVQKAVKGCDAVISTLNNFPSSQGLFGKIRTQFDLMSVSIKNTVKAMDETGIKRIVVMTAQGVGDSVKELPAIFAFLVRISNIKYSYIDHDKQEKVLENSDLNWTVVRPVGLNNKNDNISIVHKINGEGELKSVISRNAVAHFILDSIEKTQFIKQKPAISNI